MKKRDFIKSIAGLVVAPAAVKPAPIFLGHYFSLPASSNGLLFYGTRFYKQGMPIININTQQQ